ncbi:MAG: DUF3179 domain-containing protein [bacterium]
MKRLAVIALVLVLAATGAVLLSRANRGVDAAHTGEPVPFYDASEWKTNFKKHAVNLNEIISGGPPKDGIPAIDKPRFESVTAADKWLKPIEPVILFARGGDARAYPMQIMTWHEIVNDIVGSAPTVITFCPLCNTALVFDALVDGRAHDFGTTGKLRFSDLVMYDRQTESWWQQATGEAIVGDLTGKRLTFLPAQIVSWQAFRSAHPQGKVLSRNTGHIRSYGRNPYVGYDNVNSSPFLYSGPKDNRLRPMERVVTVSLGGEDVVYPFSVLEKSRVVHDVVGGQPIVVFFEKGTASALDSSDIAGGRDIGASGVFVPRAGGRSLTFLPAAKGFTDGQTRSAWTILGQATGGPLRGQRLEAVVHGNYFWFAWAVFKPKTRIYKP